MEEDMGQMQDGGLDMEGMQPEEIQEPLQVEPQPIEEAQPPAEV